MLAALLCLSLFGCTQRQSVSLPSEPAETAPGDQAETPSPEPSQTAAPEPTVEPTAEPTEEPTAEPTCKPVDLYHDYHWAVTLLGSSYADYIRTAQGILEGKGVSDSDIALFDTSTGRAYFGYSHGKWGAHNTLVEVSGRYEGPDDLPFDERYKYYYYFEDPIAEFPAELDEAAKIAMIKYWEQDPEGGEEEYRKKAKDVSYLEGYFGEDYIVFSEYGAATGSVHCIFRTDDGEHWYEFGNNMYVPGRGIRGFDYYVSGACIRSASEGYLCYYDRLYHYGELNTRRLLVFKTEDGGATWNEMGLWLPEEYEGARDVQTFSPVFDGDHGVIPIKVTPADYENEPDVICWYETTDGGKTWEFCDGK